MRHGKTRGVVVVVGILSLCGGMSAVMAAEPPGQSPSKPSATSASPAVTSTPAATASPLEGTTWPVMVIPDALAAKKGEKPFADTLMFKDGKVAMSACVKAGFAPSTYTASPVGSGWSVSTQQVSKDQGRTAWQATLTGETITGTMVWKKPDGSLLHYAVGGKKATS